MNNSEAAALWGQAVEKVRGDVSPENFDLWVTRIEPVKIEGGVLQVKVPNKFFVNWIKEHLQKKLSAALREISGAPVDLEYEVAKDLRTVMPPSDPVPEASAQSDFTLSELNPRYTFSQFVIGDSNRFACATAEAIAKKPGTQFNPYFIYGGVGLGKTHLMHAIGNAIRQENPRARVLYTTSELFVNDFIGSVQQGRPDEFRAKYRSLDCLLIDDIQFLIGKDRSEQEFFHTFNALFDAKKQVIMSSDRAPRDMAGTEQRLITRLQWGVVADIKPADLETRIAILRKKAESESFYVPDDVIVFLASVIKDSIRTMEGALIRLKAFASMTGTPLTVEEAKDILKDQLSPEDAPPVRVDTIQQVVAYKYSVEVKDIKGHSRTASIALPRQVAMYLCCTMRSDLSLKDIGKAFGNKDHTTVMHARDKIKDLLEKDPFFLEVINKLQADVKAVEGQ